MASPGTDTLLALCERMVLIRRMEERLSEVAKSGELPGAVHLTIGQEAVATGLCAHLTDDDWIASNHRGHGHFLAKGGDPNAMIAEIFGRETGICRGRGGSMHVADFGRGILGANGIVGGGIGLACGAALGAKLDGRGRVSAVFFGDGASNQGIVAEAMNLATRWSLPLVMVCENNGYGEFSPSATVTSGEIWRRAQPYGMAAEQVDGNDVVAVWEACERAVGRARAGQGPTMLEARTYRWHGHVESEKSFLAAPYRSDDEVEQWKRRDPIRLLADRLAAAGAAATLPAIDARVDAVVERAYAQALADPLPSAGSAFEGMFAHG